MVALYIANHKRLIGVGPRPLARTRPQRPRRLRKGMEEEDGGQGGIWFRAGGRPGNLNERKLKREWAEKRGFPSHRKPRKRRDKEAV